MSITTATTRAACVCCKRLGYAMGMARVARGPIHFDCWEEHHSDPTGVWPPEHNCAVEGTRHD